MVTSFLRFGSETRDQQKQQQQNVSFGKGEIIANGEMGKWENFFKINHKQIYLILNKLNKFYLII